MRLLPRVWGPLRYMGYQAESGVCIHSGKSPRIAQWNVLIYRFIKPHSEYLYQRLVRW